MEKVQLKSMPLRDLEAAINKAAKRAPVDIWLDFPCEKSYGGLEYDYDGEEYKYYTWDIKWRNRKICYKTKKLKDGYHLIVTRSPTANVAVLAEWSIKNTKIITHVELTIRSADDLSNPDTDFTQKCSLQYQYWEKNYWTKRRKRVAAYIKDGKFYDKNGPIEAVNEKQVMEELFEDKDEDNA
jgi:hypothetical protein